MNEKDIAAPASGPKRRIATAIAAVRTRLTLRRAIVAALALTLLGGGTIVLEALVRARLVAPADRVPTTLYTRSSPWDGGGGGAVPIAAIAGAPDEWRVPKSLDHVPESLVDAVLAIEDQRFFDHGGLDLRRIGGAVLANIKAGGIAEGGSTITQQLAKNLYLSSDRTPLRKLREAAMALVLEHRYSKRQILEAYLNEIYLGHDDGLAIHGVGAAANHYFGKRVGQLSLAQSATLAGMIHAPNRLAPDRHPRDARARRDLVLQLMAEQGRISESRARQAERSPVRVNELHRYDVDAHYFSDAARAVLPRGLPRRGAAVYTTLDARLQRAAQEAVDRGLSKGRLARAQAALVAIDPRNGDILAMVGGRDYTGSQFNRAIEAHRQPGSAFKPIVAVAALRRRDGDDPAFTLASTIEDQPFEIMSNGIPWHPANYDGDYRGEVTFREALEQSLNVPFARIGLAVGPEKVVAIAHQMGIKSDLPAVPALALGSGEVTLLELVRAYGVLAAGGQLAQSRMIDAVSDRDGATQPGEPVEVGRVIDPGVAYLVTSALEGVVDHGTGASLGGHAISGDLAGKTGTSSDWRDAWFIAYTPTLVVGVWVGNDDDSSIHLTGAQAALPVVRDFLREIDPEGARFERPDDVVEARVASGSAGTDWPFSCGSDEYFLAGTAPADGGGCLDIGPGDWEIHLDLDRLRDGDWKAQLRRQAKAWVQREIRDRIRDLTNN